MAKQITTGKREKEKKRQSKRLEKQQRKEVRQNSSKGGAFDDMIAYVDEHGIISATPPDLTKREVIDVENIAISIPKKTDVEEDPILKGRVEHFNQSKGYGFIKDLNSAEKYFFHISNASPDIAETNLVTFELEMGTRGMNAVRIKLTE